MVMSEDGADGEQKKVLRSLEVGHIILISRLVGAYIEDLLNRIVGIANLALESL